MPTATSRSCESPNIFLPVLQSPLQCHLTPGRIYSLEKAIHLPPGDAESRPLLQNEDPEAVFARALDVELEKISSFYALKEKELFDEVEVLLRDVEKYEEDAVEDTQRPSTRGTTASSRGRPHMRSQSLRSRDSTTEHAVDDSDDEGGEETTGLTSRLRRVSRGRHPHSATSHYRARRASSLVTSTDLTASITTDFSRRYSGTYDDYAEQAVLFSAGIMLKKRMVNLYVQLCELKSYIQLNRTGFSKVLKKFDKIIDRNMRPRYMDSFVDTAYPFLPETMKGLEHRIAQIVDAYTAIVTHGDAETALRDLRSHLREHVVWERNTVWRELIGMERRAEAATLGHQLLARETDQRPLLLGDEEYVSPTKEITTPLGRLVCPTWLVTSTTLSLLIILIIFFALLSLPILSQPEQQNCLAMLVFVSLLWATEALPLFVTSLIIPFLCVILRVFRSPGPEHARLGSKDATAAVFAAMWTPVIMLLLGGFTLAAALSKCSIDKRIATFVLSKAGTKPKTVLIANMAVAAVASMLISNVAAPVLCFGIIEPMLRNLPAGSPMSKAVIIGIALASNIGGMLSPIASPQNVVALGIMEPPPTWGQWFFIVLPVGILSITLIWLLLLITFRPARGGTTIVPIRPVRDPFTGLQWFVSLVTLATIALWCASHALEDVFGDMGVIALLPIILFFGIGVLTKEDFNNFPWTIIILAAGGLSLGKAVNSSGLLHTLTEAITQKVQGMSLYAVLVVFSSLILGIATFISHTVAALIILPLVYDVGKGLDEPHPNLLVMAGVLMCSAAMALPTSGFPNMSECFPVLPFSSSSFTLTGVDGNADGVEW